MTPEKYHFGTLSTRLEFFSYPRTGSHYLWTCLTGLLDLVYFPNEFIAQAEPRQRAEELNPHAFYVLGLRDAKVPFTPVYIDPEPRGTHALPAAGKWPVILLIRDPWPTVYSHYHTATDRWGLKVDDRVAWIRQAFAHYRDFYTAGFALALQRPVPVHVVRYEKLVAGPEALIDLVDFIGVRPKLDPKFVHWWTQFDRMTRPGPKTFFRAGNNEAWRKDESWLRDLRAADVGSFDVFGYPAPASG